MPASSRPVPVSAADNVWHRHEAQIKDLYQNQRKTLREVKRLMEEDGFPKTPLSTWESKLRERLQLRKKAKAHDWPLIYQHILPRLEQPRRKKFKKQTIIRLNDCEIPWDKAWKEIRRSGAFENDSQSTSTNPLPPEITIRTPSPGPFTPSPTPRAAQSVIFDMSTLSDDTMSLAPLPSQNSVVVPIVQPRSLTDSFSVYILQWCASSIPWLEMCQSIQPMFLRGKHTRQLEISFSSALNDFLATSAIARAVRSQISHKIASSEPRLDLLRNDQPIPPRPSPDLGYRVARSCGQIQLSQFIATAVFLLSNNLHDYEDGDKGLELLCSVLDRDAYLTTTLLRDHMPSIRATWESLLQFAISKRRGNTFRVLLSIGIHNHWLNPLRYSQCLRWAVEMHCYDIVTKVVDYCCDSNQEDWPWDLFCAILSACRQGKFECASLIIKHCDINASGRSHHDVLETNCSMFDQLVQRLGHSNDEHMVALELFLANGANVDNFAKGTLCLKWRELVGRDEFLVDTQPTILDKAFYTNRPLFDKLRPWSKVPAVTITRTGLLVALEDGSQTLRDYLSARQSVLPSFDWRHVRSLLELLLAEQFTLSKEVDLRILRGLYEFGVDFTMPSVEIDFQDFWRPENGYRRRHLDFAWHQLASVNDRICLLNMLLTNGGVIGELVLEGAVAQYGTGRLETLASHLTDFPAKAVRALVRAARANNFQDVEFLLRKGVDPNTFVIDNGLRHSIQAVATNSSKLLPDGGCSLEMTRFLARHGARLVVSPEDSTPFDFANYMLREQNTPDLNAKIKYVLSTLAEDNTLSRLPSFLLEYSLGIFPLDCTEKFRKERLELFEYFFRQGAEVSPGSPLGALIFGGGREELVREVLYSGSDLNAYFENPNGFGPFTPLQIAASNGNENLVRLLLREGADVNSPARVEQGYTALQGACQSAPATEEEHQRKMRICRLLIDHGAEINASPSKLWDTALMNAAEAGDLELAVMLLREGADVNALGGSCSNWHKTALDRAAERGRLDMVQFLLNANSLSARRGETGYVGAISHAEEMNYLAVADLIRKHAAKVDAGTVFNPELLKAQEECSRCSKDDGSSNANYEFSSVDADDMGVIGETSGASNRNSGYKEAVQTVS